MLFGKYINKYYKKFGIGIILGILFLVAVDIVQLFIPDLIGKLVELFEDGYDPENVASQVAIYGLEILVISLAMFFGRIVFRLFLFGSATKITEGLRQDMFEKAQKLDQTYYHANKIGNVMSWMTSDTEEVQDYLGWGTVMLVDGFFMTGIVLVRMFLKNWMLSLFILAPIILIIVWGLLVEKVMAKLWNGRQSVFDNMYDFCEETFTGIRVIKAFLKETSQMLRFSWIARKNKDADIKLGVVKVLFDAVIIVLIEGIVSLIIGLGGWFIYLAATGNPAHVFGRELTLTTAELVTFLNYFIILIWPLIALGSVITMHARAKTSYKRIARFMDAEEVIKDKENAIELKDVKGKIEFKNLSFSYENDDNYALKNISFVIYPGESIGVVGRVGSGKSTLVSLLSRLYNVKEKTLFFDDNDVMDCTVKSVRKAVAPVPQDNFLFSLSVEDNIKFGREDATFEDVKGAAEFSDVAKDVEGFTNKYESMTGERGISLSGGQKQRIAISRAFIKDAPIMILDDSVSSVDIDTEKKILENISSFRKNKTTIIISSRVSTVSKLDKIAVLNEGKLESFDTPINLLKISPTYKKMVELQRLEDELKEADYGRHKV